MSNRIPKRVGKVDPKTLARRAVSECTDRGSAKAIRVMLYYIDLANRDTGETWPARETVAKALGISDDAVKRANRFWTGAGQSVVWTDPAGQEHRLWLPYLRVPRKGVIHPDGSKESNLYHPGWLALLSLLSARHWDQVLREEARAIMQEEGRHGNSDEL